MRVLILGGTGFIGARVVNALRGHDVWTYERGQTGHVSPTTLRGDRAEIARHRDRLERLGVDVALDMMPRNGADARGVLDVLRSVAPRLVAVSSGSVYRVFGRLLGREAGPPEHTLCDERAPLRTCLFPYRGASPRPASDPRGWLDDYDKIPAEEAYLAAGASVVRLPMVYGPGDPDRRLAGYLRRMVDGRRAIWLHAAGAAWMNSRSYVENVAEAIACVVLRGAPGRVYNVAEPEDCSERVWIERIARVVGWGGEVAVAPASEQAWARPAIDELPPEARFEHHVRLDSGRIRRELGFIELVTAPEGLERTVHAELRAGLPFVDYTREDDFERRA
ncbi:NAD-dependent epimerase/dehydratase family protein [Sorangium sp. So ce363]|uniref:NAD-dependent epimerase/dehydratase family protein n=1 Tax=Sorangium sp. So ce363 TaxID=3133304 RepID=UPI003F5F1646